MMIHTDLADDLKAALGFGALATSQQTLDLSKDIIDHIKLGVVSNAPGTIVGSTTPASPLTLGAGTGGVVLLVPSDLQNKLITSFGVSTPEIVAMATAISTFISLGAIIFAPGSITGDCTSTPGAPGPLANGEGVGGTITLGPPATLASNIATAIGQASVSTQLTDFCAALVTYIQDNAEVSYPSGSVTGVCPMAGGPLTLGAGAGGSIV